jgi:hypothetical protein
VLPGEITPFSVLRLLERMRGDVGLALTPEQRGELDRTVGDLQRRYFAPGSEANHRADLHALAERWVTAAR